MCIRDRYNTPFLDDQVELISGYPREQGFVFRRDDERFNASATLDENLAAALGDSECMMVNRNRGSGTRVIIDQLLAGNKPPGHAIETRSHNAVCAAIKQGRTDWGIAIRPVSEDYGLGFVPVRDEQYDFVVNKSRADSEALVVFRELGRKGS